MKKYNYIVSVVMLLLSGYIFYESSGYTIGSSAQKNPAVWPCILAGALALLSVALIIETALKKEPSEEKKTIDWKSPGMIHVYIMLGIVVGFVVLMKIVGMLLALLIMIPAIEYLMGCRSKVMLLESNLPFKYGYHSFRFFLPTIDQCICYPAAQSEKISIPKAWFHCNLQKFCKYTYFLGITYLRYCLRWAIKRIDTLRYPMVLFRI